MKNRTDRIEEITTRLMDMFAMGEFPAAIARTIIKPKSGYYTPCMSWSLGNRILTLLAGTDDARGYRQWESVGRRVKKGAKAFYILAPISRKIKTKVLDGEKEEEIEKIIVKGFKAIPVFRYQDTEGEELERPDYIPVELPPLYDVALQFSTVDYLPAAGENFLGSCDVNSGNIRLHSHDVEIFFHELAHSVDRCLHGLKPGQNAEQEVIAEFSSAVLCYMYGYQGYLKYSWEYIRHYAGDDSSKALALIMKTLTRVEAIVTRILEVQDRLNVRT